MKNPNEQVDFQTDYLNDLVDGTAYGANLDARHIWYEWLNNRKENIQTYRDRGLINLFTGIRSPTHHTPFMEALDDSLECYLKLS